MPHILHHEAHVSVHVDCIKAVKEGDEVGVVFTHLGGPGVMCMYRRAVERLMIPSLYNVMMRRPVWFISNNLPGYGFDV